MDRPSGRAVTRTKTVEVSPVGEDAFRFVARLTDLGHHANRTPEAPDGHTVTIHDFGVEGVCEGPDLIVRALDVHADTHPYTECPFVLPAAQDLVGKSMMSGWRRAVLGQANGTASCTHVNTLLLGLGELAPLVFFLRINELTPHSQDTLADGRWTAGALRVSPALTDVCHGLRSDGLAVTLGRQRIDPPPL
jgi:Protein of unknown function (DUF2889)